MLTAFCPVVHCCWYHTIMQYLCDKCKTLGPLAADTDLQAISEAIPGHKAAMAISQ